MLVEKGEFVITFKRQDLIIKKGRGHILCVCVKNPILSSDLDMKIHIYLAAVKFRKFDGKWIKGSA